MKLLPDGTNMVHDQGHMVNPQLRNNCRGTAFADTIDSIGPLGAKSQGECAVDPMATAIAYALADATDVRFAHLPFTPDRPFAALAARP